MEWRIGASTSALALKASTASQYLGRQEALIGRTPILQSSVGDVAPLVLLYAGQHHGTGSQPGKYNAVK